MLLFDFALEGVVIALLGGLLLLHGPPRGIAQTA